MLVTVHDQRHFMATTFEAFLAGEDEEHLHAVLGAVWKEVERLERLLSRFDPSSEIARLNREAPHRPVLVDYEMWNLLHACECYRRGTGGYFAVMGGQAALLFDDKRRTVRLTKPGGWIDLGAFGKGYALDCAGAVLRRFGITSALLHGGTSSILTVGTHPAGHPWLIGLRDPFGNNEGSCSVLPRLALVDRSFSCSAVFSPGQAVSDIIDPCRQTPLTEQAACVVLAAYAAEAEALSTACLSMGREQAQRHATQHTPAGLHIGWIDGGPDEPRFTWLTEAP